MISIVIPIFNEEKNISNLVREIDQVIGLTHSYEIICVDDASDDETAFVLCGLMRIYSCLRVITHSRQSGQSTAVRNGVLNAKSDWVVTLDGDGQNDPADIPALLARRDSSDGDVKLVAGWRTYRQDTMSKRLASRFANGLRARILNDATPDSGCGIKLFERSAFLNLPYFDHMHRYLPALMQRDGWKTVSEPVGHRARSAGVSNYTNLGRAVVGISDLLGVAWLIRRSRVTMYSEPAITRGASYE